MPLLIILVTIISVLIAFISGANGSNAFTAYYSVLYNFLVNNWTLIIIGFTICCAIFLWRVRLGNAYSLSNKIFISIFQVSATVFVGTFVGFVVLLVIAWGELNILALIIDFDPSVLGIIDNIHTISAKLQSNQNPPQVITSDTDNYQELLGIATATTGTDTVYGSSVLSSIPDLLVLPIIQPSSSMLLIDNTLIITKIKNKDLQQVSPIIINRLIQNYFPTRKIKAYPKISILTTFEYAKVRSNEYASKLARIDQQLQIITADISSTSASIQHDNDMIASEENTINDATKQNETQYTACVNAGYYQGDTYVHYHTQTYCQGVLQDQQSTSATATNDLATWQKQLTYDQDELKGYQYYQKFFTSQETLMQVTKANIPLEVGLFVPPDTLQLVINHSQTHDIVNYFELLAHEYLHYASYSPDKQFQSSLFEEGLTEYFARQAIKDTFHIDTNLGYPAYVKIITEMTKIIPESELADIYFTKDEARLEKTLDRVYGDAFYSNNLVLFETLQYTSDPDQQLDLANKIMDHIQGPHLTLKDLESSNSSL